MAEVIEINLVSSKKLKISDLLKFISLQMNDIVIKKTIEIMDNWKYENVFEITSEEDIEKFIDNKIVCITEILSIGQAGITIEAFNSCYIYSIWFNWKKELPNVKYIELLNRFIKYICNTEEADDILICAIGKEVQFKYLNNIKETISTAHNIDVWIVDKDDYIDNNFENYKVLEVENYRGSKKQKYVVIKIF